MLPVPVRSVLLSSFLRVIPRTIKLESCRVLQALRLVGLTSTIPHYRTASSLQTISLRIVDTHVSTSSTFTRLPTSTNPRHIQHPITMKLSLAAALALTILAELRAAWKCHHNYSYCGHVLNKRSTYAAQNDFTPKFRILLTPRAKKGNGKYQSVMELACQKENTTCPGEQVQNHVFKCYPDRHGRARVLLEWECTRDRCIAAGLGDDDFCLYGPVPGSIVEREGPVGR